jgi:hypothetical protein
VPCLTLAQRHLAGAPPSPWALIAWIATRQHGIVTAAQLLEAGLGRSAITRAAASGRLHRLYRGVYAVGHRGLSREGRWMAAVLAAGEGAALSHLCAAALWELRVLRTDFVTVIAPRQCRPKGPVRVHECRNLDTLDVTTRRGIPVTTVARMFVDLTDILTPHQLANVIHEAAYRKRFSVDATRQAMRRANGRHNLHVLELALALNASGSAGTKSANEDAFLSLLPLAGIPEPRVNMRLLGEEVDCHWPDRTLVVEVDGPGHTRDRSMRDDARRDAKLRAAGYTVLRFTDQDIEHRADEVIGRVQREF